MKLMISLSFHFIIKRELRSGENELLLASSIFENEERKLLGKENTFKKTNFSRSKILFKMKWKFNKQLYATSNCCSYYGNEFYNYVKSDWNILFVRFCLSFFQL